MGIEPTPLVLIKNGHPTSALVLYKRIRFIFVQILRLRDTRHTPINILYYGVGAVGADAVSLSVRSRSPPPPFAHRRLSEAAALCRRRRSISPTPSNPIPEAS